MPALVHAAIHAAAIEGNLLQVTCPLPGPLTKNALVLERTSILACPLLMVYECLPLWPLVGKALAGMPRKL